VGQGHAAADRVEDALRDALPDADVVVHVEPRSAEGAGIRERALAAALGVFQVREIHNLAVLEVGGRTEISLHLKLPGDLSLEQAHAIAEQVERQIAAAVPEADAVRTHLEPLAEPAAGEEATVDQDAVAAAVREETGSSPRELRFVRTDDGIVAFVTVALDARESLADAHERASALEERVRGAVPGIAEVVVHTEP
jgi:divalent metal cation (Fe/Co/Zn/Cd) transporter